VNPPAARSAPAQSFRRYPLSHLLATSSHVRLLRSLARSGSPMSTSQLVRATGLSSQGVRNVLASLRDQSVIMQWGERRSQVHALRADHPLAPALVALFAAEAEHWAEFNNDLIELLVARSRLVAAWLYGSVSRGQDSAGSDVDLAVFLQ
jgi:hypothetical protein